MRTTVIYEGPVGVVVDTQSVRIVGTEASDLAATVRREAVAGVGRIELCGGFGSVPHADVEDLVRAVDSTDARVGAVLYGFESLEATTDFKQRSIAGEQLPAAFLYLASGADPIADRIDHEGATFVPVPTQEAAGPATAALAEEGVILFELYAGLGAQAARAALREVQGRASVGLVSYSA